MYDAKSFVPTFPSMRSTTSRPRWPPITAEPSTPEATGLGPKTLAHGATGVISGTPDILSGVTPLTGTWAAALAGSPAKKALVYGYQVTSDPFV